MDSTKILAQSCPHLNGNNITYNLSGKQVFREQCMKCYEDPVGILVNIAKRTRIGCMFEVFFWQLSE